MKECGIVLQVENAKARRVAEKMGLGIAVSANYAMPWERTCFITPGVMVPWEMLEYGFHFLERWDAAAPLWRYGVLAADMGSAEERQRTQKIVVDLRLLTLEPGLLFVRRNEVGQALIEAWRKECRPGWDVRLAFLRALHIVKPKFCALPRSWLADEEQRSKQDLHTRTVMRSVPQALVRVEIGPGRFIRCRPGDEERTKRHYQQIMAHRHERTKT